MTAYVVAVAASGEPKPIKNLDLDAEGTAFVWLSSMLLAGCALAAAGLWALEPPDRRRRHWLGIAVGFAAVGVTALLRARRELGPMGRRVLLVGAGLMVAALQVEIRRRWSLVERAAAG